MKRSRERQSQISRHPERLSIELASTAGMSLDRIAERWGVQRDAIWRHMKALDPAYRAALIADVPMEELAQRAAQDGTSLLDNLAVLRRNLMHAAIEAKASGDHYALATLSTAAIKCVAQAGKLNGELRTTPTILSITNNTAVLMASPMMQQLQNMLARRLAPFPEALGAVLEGLAELQAAPPPPETDPAQVIDARAA